VHQAPTSGPGTSAGGTGVTLLAPSLYIAPQVQPIVMLPGLIDGFICPKMPSRRASMHLRHDFLHLAVGDDYLGHLLLSIGQLPVMFQHTVSQFEGFSLGPTALVDGPRLLMSLHSGCCPASISHINGPRSLSANCCLLRACWSQPSAAAVTTILTLWPSARSTFWHWEHPLGHGRLERESALVCLML
jgi:hypothetical protein